jgi:hypothetical protein
MTLWSVAVILGLDPRVSYRAAHQMTGDPRVRPEDDTTPLSRPPRRDPDGTVPIDPSGPGASPGHGYTTQGSPGPPGSPDSTCLERPSPTHDAAMRRKIRSGRWPSSSGSTRGSLTPRRIRRQEILGSGPRMTRRPCPGPRAGTPMKPCAYHSGPGVSPGHVCPRPAAEDHQIRPVPAVSASLTRAANGPGSRPSAATSPGRCAARRSGRGWWRRTGWSRGRLRRASGWR